jgi:branched-chain amino acid transport system substrate-binding protein
MKRKICGLALLATVLSAPSVAKAGDYTIGVIVPLSGQVAFIGEAAVKAMTLKVEQINAAGGINGHKLKLEAQDDKCDPTAAVNIAQRFVNSSDVVGVLGPFCSAASIAVKPVFSRAKMVNLTVASTSDAITQGTTWSFQIAAPDGVYAATLANYAADHGKRVAVLNDTSAFGLGAYATVDKVLKERNANVVAHEQITAGQPDVTPQILKMKQSAADFVIALVLGGDAAKVCLTSRDLGFTAQLAGQTAWSFPNVLSLSKGACDGAIFTDPFEPSKPEAKAFLDVFEKRWSERPQYYFPAAGWDAISLWSDAAKAAGTANSDEVDQTKLLAALNQVKGYKGAMGVGNSTFNFSDSNHIALGLDGTHLRRISGNELLPVNAPPK